MPTVFCLLTNDKFNKLIQNVFYFHPLYDPQTPVIS